MTYLFIILVIAIALAPLSHFVPSKRQRAIAGMREYAAVHGMFVEFRQVPGKDSGRISDRDGASSNTIYYGKRLPASRQKRQAALAWINEKGTWVGLERRLPVPPVLAELPSQVLAAGADESSCGVYWREAGTVEDVEQIRRVLELWVTQLRA